MRLSVLIALVWAIVPVSTGASSHLTSAPAKMPSTAPAQAETQPAEYKRSLPLAARDRVDERHTMVERQLANPRDSRQPILDERVLQAIRDCPRHIFVVDRFQGRAYDDTPLPIEHGQTISQPYIVGLMTELLNVDGRSRVLEIGTGSGYQAAVLAHITPHVYSVEIIEPLAASAREALEAQGYSEVRTKHADGYHGWAEHGPYDAIIVTAAAGHLPPPLWEQLKPGGRIVIPIGGTFEVQRLIVVDKTEEGRRRSRAVLPVRFVPLTRGADQ